MNAQFILVSIDTKISMKQQELAEKAFFLKGTQNGEFWPKCKGGTLCKKLKIGHFFGLTLKGYKILNTSRILASLVWMDAEFILVSIDTTICIKQQELAEK